MDKKAYMKPEICMEQMLDQEEILAGSGDHVYGESVSGSGQMSRYDSDWDDEDW